MLSSHYHHHKSKTFSQLTQCPFTGTLLLFININELGVQVFDNREKLIFTALLLGMGQYEKCVHQEVASIAFVH